MIYLSGQIGNLPGTLDLPDGIEAQTRQAMENIKTVLEAAGASLYDVVKCTVFLDNMDDYWAMNDVYASYWNDAPPARSAFGAEGLALGALLEIECLARDPAAASAE
jgi:reactive intermediate/imine deaminase